MLEHDLVHGDLSAYNILYWDGEITLIDFPQVVSLQGNPDAYTILQRDIRRVCEYFARQGVRCDADSIMDDLWHRHVGREDDWLMDDPITYNGGTPRQGNQELR